MLSATRPLTRMACAAALLLLARPASAQLSNTWTVPRGVLRLGFSPQYTSYDHRFAASGAVQDLGFDLSGDNLSATIFPTMIPATSALRSITLDTTLDVRLGNFKNKLDADIRRFPLSAAFGFSDRLTLSVNVPIVTVRINDRLSIDSTAQAGLNPVVGANAAANITQIQTLLNELTAAANTIDANIAANQYGCPGSAQCAQAQALATRTRSVRDNLILLTGVPVAGFTTNANPPPFAPLASSPAGAAITAAIQSLATQLAAFGATGVTGTLPLPAARADTGAVQSVLLGDAYGYSADSLTMRRRTSLGDVEVGLHYGIVQAPHARAVITGIVRLPTGNLASPASYTELSTGDHQTDLEGRLDLALEPGDALGMWGSASYTVQMADQLTRRVAPPHAPLALASSAFLLSRHLGNMAQVAFGPELRLSNEVRVFGSAAYFWKGLDSYEYAGPLLQNRVYEPADVLNQDTGMQVWSFGGGVSYRSTRSRSADQLPIEAGLSYSSAYSGSGGFTPQATTLNLYLRLFYRIFGGGELPAPAPTTPTMGH